MPGSSIAGLPAQWLLVQDPLVAGGDAAAWATSEYGPGVGITEPNASNVGALLPTVYPDPTPDADTSPELTLQVVQGGGLGTAEWVYLPGLVDDASRTVEWRGYHSELYQWGHHAPFNSGSSPGGAVAIYSSAYRRLILAAKTASGNISILSTNNADMGDLPENETDWDQLTTINPDGGPSTYEHGLAGVELRDGTLLLAVRKRYLSSSSSDSIVLQGDWDLYRSTDGGSTWTRSVVDLFRSSGLAATVPMNRATVRIAVSGSWVRLCYTTNDGYLGTLSSSDNGVTWSAGTLITSITPKSSGTQTNDRLTYDLVGLDDQTGTFILAAGATASKSIQFWVATRDDDWSTQTLVNITGLTTPRALFFVRDPYWLTLYARVGDPGNAASGWILYRVKRDDALISGSWSTITDWFGFNGANRLCPIQARAVWCGDKAAVIAHLQDMGSGTPYGHVNNRPILWWIGGWSIRPFANDYGINDDSAEVFRWTYDFGEPAGGATSSTLTSWLQTITGSGTHSWNPDGMEFETYTASDSAFHRLVWDTPSDFASPPQWDAADSNEEARWQRDRPFVMEWVMTVGNTAPTGGSYVCTRITMPSAQLSPAGWRITLRHSTDGIVVWDAYRSVALATLAIDLTTYDNDNHHRIRFAVSPAATPSNPTGVLAYSQEYGDEWTETSPIDLGQPYGAATATQTAILFGHASHTGTNTVVSRWREVRLLHRWGRVNYGAGSWTAPADLPGARATGRPRSIGSGATTTDALRLAVGWGGGGAAAGDRYVHALGHSGAAELAGSWRSPSRGWTSAAGATSGSSTYVAWDAGWAAPERSYSSPSDTGARFVHSHAALFGLRAVSGRIEYADEPTFASPTIAATYSTIFATGVTVASVDGYRVGVNTTGLTHVGRTALAGKLLVAVSGTPIGRVWRVDSHRYDENDGIHYLDLDRGGQFNPTSLTVGGTVWFGSDRVWVDYGQTLRGRYVRVIPGLSTTNNWDGRFGVGLFVPGLAWQLHPPMAWSRSDEERARVTRHETRSGESWGRKEGAPSRSISGRLLGDDREALWELRGILRSIASYGVRPMALLLDDERTTGPDGQLLPVEWVGDSVIDVQAFRRDAADVIRALGDEQITLRELV